MSGPRVDYRDESFPVTPASDGQAVQASVPPGPAGDGTIFVSVASFRGAYDIINGGCDEYVAMSRKMEQAFIRLVHSSLYMILIALTPPHLVSCCSSPPRIILVDNIACVFAYSYQMANDAVKRSSLFLKMPRILTRSLSAWSKATTTTTSFVWKSIAARLVSTNRTTKVKRRESGVCLF